MRDGYISLKTQTPTGPRKRVWADIHSGCGCVGGMAGGVKGYVDIWVLEADFVIHC